MRELNCRRSGDTEVKIFTQLRWYNGQVGFDEVYSNAGDAPLGAKQFVNPALRP